MLRRVESCPNIFAFLTIKQFQAKTLGVFGTPPSTTRYDFASLCLCGPKKFCGGDSKNTPGRKNFRAVGSMRSWEGFLRKSIGSILLIRLLFWNSLVQQHSSRK